MASKEIKIGKMWLNFGYSFQRLALGFSIDKYHMEVDVAFFWFSWEF